jgi:hypothetical protein
MAVEIQNAAVDYPQKETQIVEVKSHWTKYSPSGFLLLTDFRRTFSHPRWPCLHSRTAAGSIT